MAHGVVHHVGCPAANGTPSTRLAARSVRAAHNRTFTRTCTHATARTHTHTAAHDGDTDTRTHMHALSRCKGSCIMCLASAGEAASRASDASCTFADARRFGHGAAVVKHPQSYVTQHADASCMPATAKQHRGGSARAAIVEHTCESSAVRRQHTSSACSFIRCRKWPGEAAARAARASCSFADAQRGHGTAVVEHPCSQVA